MNRETVRGFHGPRVKDPSILDRTWKLPPVNRR
jgi:hypothetical protein